MQYSELYFVQYIWHSQIIREKFWRKKDILNNRINYNWFMPLSTWCTMCVFAQFVSTPLYFTVMRNGIKEIKDKRYLTNSTTNLSLWGKMFSWRCLCDRKRYIFKFHIAENEQTTIAGVWLCWLISASCWNFFWPVEI